jgi:hypothetical protein
MKRSILFLFILNFLSALSVPLRALDSSFAFFAPLRETGCSLPAINSSFASFAPLRETGCSPRAISSPFASFGPDSLPDLNRSIIAFVDSKMKKKVGRGECWDLAAEALNASGAQWDGKFHFGRKLEKGEAILPGDIIQFEGVKIKYQDGNARYTEVMKHHTGIVYSMKGERSFDMANQNTAAHGKKVSLLFVDLDQVTTGKISIYRPVRK